MSRQPLNVVWLKRDLRTQDHEPLLKAEQADEDYVILFLYEPSLVAYPDTSMRHLQFCYHAIKDMNQTLDKVGRHVRVMYGEAVDFFKQLCESHQINKVFSYQESGIRKTWDRDKSVSRFFKQQGITWEESQRDGIKRGIRNRKNWDKQWKANVISPIIQNSYSRPTSDISIEDFALPRSFEDKLVPYPETLQPAGETIAWSYLSSFCESRGVNYFRHISKPKLSRTSCARISPYLAWGCLSIRQVYQYVSSHPCRKKYKMAYRQFLTRLHWHCHFIQKFEVDCNYEAACINPGYEQLPRRNKSEDIIAWKEGRTGYPLVDACMRCVIETGWINFRMRAIFFSVPPYGLRLAVRCLSSGAAVP